MALTKVSRGLLTTSIVDNGNATAITIDASENVTFAGNVGIGTSSPSKGLHLNFSNDLAAIRFQNTANAKVWDLTPSIPGVANSGFSLHNVTDNTVPLHVDNSGNLLVGTTTTNIATEGTVIYGSGNEGVMTLSSTAMTALYVNRSNGGELAQFRTGGSTVVGSIGVDSIDLFVSFSQTNNIGIKSGVTGGTPVLFPCGNTGSARDNAASWGYANGRWKEIFAVNGSINTSDRNEKQDIAELTDAEQRVAVACKGLLRKFRWIDAVAEKGDDARIHFGIIAQDLQAAFEAEGLDAARYAMFTSNTWWETQTEVAAVEATEDSEAVDAYTRTDTYDTAEEAPEGATERTRLGVRYSELLAFIISAI